PTNRNLHLASAFLQDQIGLFDDRLLLTLGSKFEYGTLSGFQFQPSARLMWNATRTQRVWAAFSRATRTPSRGEKDAEVNLLGVPQLGRVVLLGNSDFGSEEVLSYELGYRAWPLENWSFDAAVFFNDYDDLIFAEQAAVTELGKIPLRIVNGEKARTWGVELATDWRPTDWLRLQLSYTYLRMNFDRKGASDNGPALGFSLGDKRDPQQQLSFRGSFDLQYGTELDIWLRYADGIPDITVIDPERLPPVKAYVALDIRLGWHAGDNLELALVGRDLNNARHLEYLNTIATFPTLVERSYYAQVKWKF
ncbi:MAG: TonB-dependent receptor plug domain-containing protein, partial [Gammaproteobacteria bacterium]